MANRSSNSSIVDRLLAARASDKSKPRPAASASQDKPLGPYPSATMSASERRELVQRMLQQRKQATFTDMPSSPLKQSHRPDEPASSPSYPHTAAAPTFSPSKPSTFRPGELISPASSPEGSTRADPARKLPHNLISYQQNSNIGFQDVSDSSHMPLQRHGLDQHRYAAAALEAEASEEPPALHACMSPPIHTKGGGRRLDADPSPASLGSSQLRPHPPQHQSPSPRPPPATRRRSKDSPSQHLPKAVSPGIEPVPEHRAFAQSYGPSAADPLLIEMSSMVLRGEHSDASLQHPDAHTAVHHAYTSADAERGQGNASAYSSGPVLAPELSWQSTGASDSLGEASEHRVGSAVQPQLAQSRPESLGHESSTTQSLYFACDLLAEGSVRMSQQHTAESSGSFHHDSLRQIDGSAPHAVRDTKHASHTAHQHAPQPQRQSLISSRMGCMPPMAYSTTSALSMHSDVLERVAAVDPFATTAPVPSAEPSGAFTDVSAQLTASGWPSIPTEAWGPIPGTPTASDAPPPQGGRATGAVHPNSHIHSMHALQSLPAAAPPTGSTQLEAMHGSFADSWQTQSVGALEQEEAVGNRRVRTAGAQQRGGGVDLTAPVGRSGTGGAQPRGRGRTRQEVLEEVMRERAAKGPQPRSDSARPGARPGTAGARGTAALDFTAAGGSGRIEQLARPRSIERYTARQKDAEEEQLKECTFAPQIHNRRSASARRASHRRDLSVPAGERLHHAHDHVAKVRTRKQTEAMQEELAACTFAPQLRTPPGSLAKKQHVPLHERAAQLVKQKNARLAQTRMNQELFDPQATFAPALNQRSIRLAALAAARRSKQPLHASMPGGVGIVCPSSHNPSDTHASNADTLSNYGPSFSASWAHPASRKANQSMGHSGNARMGSMRASMGARSTQGSQRGRSTSPRRVWKGLEPSDSKDCTFAPAVNVATDAYLHKAGIPATFDERQEYYEQRRMEQAHVKQAALDPECTFHPQTANPEEILAASSSLSRLTTFERRGSRRADPRAHLDETQEEFWLRMTSEATRRECMLRAIDNIQQQQFTFAPSINPRSRRMARSKKVDELATDPQRHAFREAAAAAAEHRLAQECTFCPDTSKPGVPGGVGVEPKAPFTVSGQQIETIIERIHEYQDGRCRKLEEFRNRREWAELQECTFAPKTNTGKPRSRASSQAPVLVRGLDAHMSKLERAKKMAAEEAARRSKIFLEEPKVPRAKFTIAKPFNISDNHPGRGLKKMQIQEERKAQSMKECTFKPETNEGKKRQILEEILAAESPLMF